MLPNLFSSICFLIPQNLSSSHLRYEIYKQQCLLQQFLSFTIYLTYPKRFPKSIVNSDTKLTRGCDNLHSATRRLRARVWDEDIAIELESIKPRRLGKFSQVVLQELASRLSGSSSLSHSSANAIARGLARVKGSLTIPLVMENIEVRNKQGNKQICVYRKPRFAVLEEQATTAQISTRKRLVKQPLDVLVLLSMLSCNETVAEERAFCLLYGRIWK